MGLPGFANAKTVAKTLALDALQANVMVALWRFFSAASMLR